MAFRSSAGISDLDMYRLKIWKANSVYERSFQFRCGCVSRAFGGPFQLNYQAYPVHRNWDLLGQEKTAIRSESFQNNGLEGELEAISRLSIHNMHSENSRHGHPLG